MMRLLLLAVSLGWACAFKPLPRASLTGGKPCLPSAVPTTARVLMSDDEPALKFETAVQGEDDAPVLDEVEVVQEMTKDNGGEDAALVPEEELTDAELRDRQRMLAIKKYAPWMADMASPEAIAAREAAERERKQKKAEKLVGNRIDPAKQEVSGSGLKIRVDADAEGGDVKLSWIIGGGGEQRGLYRRSQASGRCLRGDRLVRAVSVVEE